MDNPRVYRDLPQLCEKNVSVSDLTELSKLCLNTENTDIDNQIKAASSPLLLDF